MPPAGRSKILLYLVIVTLLATSVAAGAVAYLQRQPPTTILLVRHAERQDAPPAPGECPPPGLGIQNSTGTSITDAGRERAADGLGPLPQRSGARGFVPKAELSGDGITALLAA